jgi:hypothetical protein
VRDSLSTIILIILTIMFSLLFNTLLLVPTTSATEQGHPNRRAFLSNNSLTLGRDELPDSTLPLHNNLPISFDSRTRWPRCTSIRDIYDQSACGDCWAVSSAMTATDRWCIAHNQTENPRLSVEQLVGCCHKCVRLTKNNIPNIL